MILAFDCSTAACTAALFTPNGNLIAARDEVIGRGHAERLVPLIDELLDGRVPDEVLVGVGPGSFTGLRVALAAAHGLAIGWGARLNGMPSLALLAASAPGKSPVVAAMSGGHGELFVQAFGRAPFGGLGEAVNLSAGDAAVMFSQALAVGSGAAALVAARGFGEGLDLLPSAAHALRLPGVLRSLASRPLYVRAPDARPKAA